MCMQPQQKFLHWVTVHPHHFFVICPCPQTNCFRTHPLKICMGLHMPGNFIARHSFDAVIGEAILNVDIAPRDWEVITLEDDTYASANVIRKQTKRSSKWLPEELRTQC